MDKVQEFKNIVKQMAETYEKKNNNYGDSFGDTYAKLGAISGLVRLYDKLNRATSLVNGSENHYESLEDTFIDMACYAIMNVIELRNEKSKLTKSYINENNKSNDIFVTVKEYDPYDTHRTAVGFPRICETCQRRLQVNGCDGCKIGRAHV